MNGKFIVITSFLIISVESERVLKMFKMMSEIAMKLVSVSSTSSRFDTISEKVAKNRSTVVLVNCQ